jgi:hypothetical protein
MDAAGHLALSDVILRVDHLEEVIIYFQNRSGTELGCDHHRNLEGGQLRAALARLSDGKEPPQKSGYTTNPQLFYAISGS